MSERECPYCGGVGCPCCSDGGSYDYDRDPDAFEEPPDSELQEPPDNE